MKLFCIWNGAFNLQHVFAESLDKALDISIASGHLRKRVGVRKWSEFDYENPPFDHPGTADAIALNKSGVGTYTEGEGWVITAVK